MTEFIRIMNSSEGRLVALGIVLLLLAIFPPFAEGQGAVVTSGTFDEFQAGETRYDDIGGYATMIRTPSEMTIVSIHVTGLAPDQAYPVHVHDAPCATGGGGHYKHDPDGPPEPPNEIWLSFSSNANGTGNSQAQADFWARDEAQSIVVHDYSDSARIACADLAPGS